MSERLLDEGRVLARLDDPGVVRVYDVDVHEGRPFVAEAAGVRAEGWPAVRRLRGAESPAGGKGRVMSNDAEEPDFEKGDYVDVVGTGEQGRIIGLGAQPGTWRVRLVDGSEEELPAGALEPTY